MSARRAGKDDKRCNYTRAFLSTSGIIYSESDPKEEFLQRAERQK